MKKLILAACAALLLLVGLFWALRRRPGRAPQEGRALPLVMEPAGAGRLFRRVEDGLPLRAIRWVPSGACEAQAAQIQTQSNRQQLVLLTPGAEPLFLELPRPQGLRDGFFNFMELRDFWVRPGDVAVLLYGPAEPGSPEAALLLALDLRTRDLRWSHRGAAAALRVWTGGTDPVLWTFGAGCPVQRMPLALQKGEKETRGGGRSCARIFELPAEAGEPGDLLPTGAQGCLLAHGRGLSALDREAAWTHHPLPGEPAQPAQGPGPRLARAGRSLWWQPWPGTLCQVDAGGALQAQWGPASFPVEGPEALDARMLTLLGADAKGGLWLGLSLPRAAPAAPAGEGAWRPEGPAPAQDPGLWQAWLALGQNRVYRWDPAALQLRRAAWAALQPPPGVEAPAGDGGLRPASGALILSGPKAAWILPLEALPLEAPLATPRPAVPEGDAQPGGGTAEP